jgi:hypothetical protein
MEHLLPHDVPPKEAVQSTAAPSEGVRSEEVQSEEAHAIELPVRKEQPEETLSLPASPHSRPQDVVIQESDTVSPGVKVSDDGPTSQSLGPSSVQVIQDDQGIVHVDMVPNPADIGESDSSETQSSALGVESHVMDVDEVSPPLSSSEDRGSAQDSMTDVHDSVSFDTLHSPTIEPPDLPLSREEPQAGDLEIEIPVEPTSSSLPILSNHDSITESRHQEPVAAVTSAAPSSSAQPPICVRPQDTLLNLPPRSPIFAPAPMGPIPLPAEFSFEIDPAEVLPKPANPTPFGHLETIHQPEYTLPPLKYLPSEYQRRGRIRSQRKKQDRGSEKDWAPLGLNRWGIMMHINPVFDKVSKATKCLSTRDWSVSSIMPFFVFHPIAFSFDGPNRLH